MSRAFRHVQREGEAYPTQNTNSRHIIAYIHTYIHTCINSACPTYIHKQCMPCNKNWRLRRRVRPTTPWCVHTPHVTRIHNNLGYLYACMYMRLRLRQVHTSTLSACVWIVYMHLWMYVQPHSSWSWRVLSTSECLIHARHAHIEITMAWKLLCVPIRLLLNVIFCLWLRAQRNVCIDTYTYIHAYMHANTRWTQPERGAAAST